MVENLSRSHARASTLSARLARGAHGTAVQLVRTDTSAQVAVVLIRFLESLLLLHLPMMSDAGIIFDYLSSSHQTQTHP